VDQSIQTVWQWHAYSQRCSVLLRLLPLSFRVGTPPLTKLSLWGSLTHVLDVALTLSIPSFLLGTAGTIRVSTRALGGIIGITIFTATFDNKSAAHLGTYAPTAVKEQGYNATVVEEVMGLLESPNPAALPKSGLPPRLIGAVVKTRGLSCGLLLLAFLRPNAVASCFLKSVAPNMNHHIQSALEKSEVRQEQLEAKVVV
jgi:hypothetical protein